MTKKNAEEEDLDEIEDPITRLKRKMKKYNQQDTIGFTEDKPPVFKK